MMNKTKLPASKMPITSFSVFSKEKAKISKKLYYYLMMNKTSIFNHFSNKTWKKNSKIAFLRLLKEVIKKKIGQGDLVT